LFVHKDSIVRKIWGRSDMVLLVFAGASAEFALNKAVDWLYFTGRLPADPIGRLFSTVRYAQEIVFAEYDAAHAAIDKITAIHKGVEASRGARIPDTAYLDVLFMLIDYSIRAFELLERKLSEEEKARIFGVFHLVGSRMGLRELPDNYHEWELRRSEYLETNLVCSAFTKDLYQRYQESLGSFRYHILIHTQTLLVPAKVRQLLSLPSAALLYPILPIYKGARFLRADRLVKAILLPSKYKAQIAGLDILSGQ
ncbi:MAG TPA: oxygenase MpaB family protein, partial [Puia sp.]|nr:oxygenase MpaB family protein [Puia sp.]